MKETNSTNSYSWDQEILEQGFQILYGDDPNKDIEKGMELVHQSGDHMCIAAMYMNGHFVERDYEKARSVLEDGMQKGSHFCKLHLSYFYELGLGGVDVDKKKAFVLIDEAFKYCFAHYQLARCYEYGIGVEQDYSKSLEILNEMDDEEIELLGLERIYESLARHYEHGLGVEKDSEKAAYYMRKYAKGQE